MLNRLKKIGVRRALAGFTILLATSAIIAGLIVANSPAEQRGRKLDQRRSESLNQIRNAVSTYQTEHGGELPSSLEDLAQSASIKPYYLSELGDPETGDPYEYRKTSPDTFELCAVFADRAPDGQEDYYRPMPVMPLGSAEPDFWRHDFGRVCWTATENNEKTFCSPDLSCPSEQTCAAVPGNSRPLCLNDDDLCSSAGCADTCSVTKTLPVQITCVQTIPEKDANQ